VRARVGWGAALVALIGVAGGGLWVRSDRVDRHEDSSGSTVSTYPYDETSCANPMPPMVVRAADRQIELDGVFNPAPKPNPEGSVSAINCDYGFQTDVQDLGTTNGFTIDFVPSWDLTVSYDFGPCLVQRPAVVTSDADGHHVVGLAGPAGSYRVQIRGRGPEGSLSTAFGVTTTEAGPEPEPSTDASTYGSPDDNEEMRSFGFTMVLIDIAPSHLDSARMIATDADGRRAQVPMGTREAPPEEACRFDLEVAGADLPAVEAVDTLPIRFQYEVVLDGVTYQAEATYPTDLDEETTSFHPIFSPGLPALAEP